MPRTESELASTKFSYMVSVTSDYQIMPNMKELKDQGRLSIIDGEGICEVIEDLIWWRLNNVCQR